MMGINLESQLIAIKKFIKKNKKRKTVILYPDNAYAKHIEKNINFVNIHDLNNLSKLIMLISQLLFDQKIYILI